MFLITAFRNNQYYQMDDEFGNGCGRKNPHVSSTHKLACVYCHVSPRPFCIKYTHLN